MSLGTTSISELPVSNNSSAPPPNIQLQTKDTNETINNNAQQLTQ